jgi:hypothetical protein
VADLNSEHGKSSEHPEKYISGKYQNQEEKRNLAFSEPVCTLYCFALGNYFYSLAKHILLKRGPFALSLPRQ